MGNHSGKVSVLGAQTTKYVGDISTVDLLNLIQGCIEEERKSQKELYQLFYGYAMSVCLRYSQTPEEATEVLNDGFLKIFLKVKMYNPAMSFKGWLRRIMINTALDNYRHNLKHYYAQDVTELERETSAEGVEDKLGYEDLIRLVQELSPAYRTVFNLYVIDGFTHEEIATMLSVSVGTSKSNLSKARAHLQARLKKSLKDEYPRYA
ncbi:MAG: polymerase sigma 70 [Adhaeribacter sp.]|nr:polymerase sigma 70 [Adhaeribacter sp.]